VDVARRVAVQQRHRLFREGLGRLLDAESDLELVGTVATGDDLIGLCEGAPVDVVVLEADSVDWDARRLATRLLRRSPGVRMVGLWSIELGTADATALGTTGVRLLRRSEGMSPILGAVRASRGSVRSAAPSARSRPSWGPRPELQCLTDREVSILVLVGGGWTSKEISGKLDISPKTVENHKQRIFAKLGVQNQAHAVSVAMRQGLVTPDALGEFATAGRP
jgi:DNA-binding NarL/FixJ family response regulator